MVVEVEAGVEGGGEGGLDREAVVVERGSRAK